MLKCRYKQLINCNMDGIELEPFNVHKSQPIAIVSSFAFSATVCFSQHLKRETCNGSVSPRCTLLAMLFATGSFEQCCIRLIKVLHKFCNTDMLRVLLIYRYPHSPLGAARPRDCVYISVKRLATVLQYIIYIERERVWNA